MQLYDLRLYDYKKAFAIGGCPVLCKNFVGLLAKNIIS